MNDRRAAQRYAKVFFEGARRRGVLAAVQADIAALRALLREVPAFGAFLANRLLTQERRSALLAQLLEGRLGAWTYRFLQLLERHRQLHLLDAVAAAFETLGRRAAGVRQLTIASAAPLAPEQIRAIEAALAARLPGLRQLEVTARHEPALLGGFTVRVDDLLYDLSLAHQLARLHTTLVQA